MKVFLVKRSGFAYSFNRVINLPNRGLELESIKLRSLIQALVINAGRIRNRKPSTSVLHWNEDKTLNLLFIAGLSLLTFDWKLG